MSKARNCSECGNPCDEIGSLNDKDQVIALCCECRAKKADPFSFKTIWYFWCILCSSRIADDLEFRLSKLMKREKIEK